MDLSILTANAWLAVYCAGAALIVIGGGIALARVGRDPVEAPPRIEVPMSLPDLNPGSLDLDPSTEATLAMRPAVRQLRPPGRHSQQ